MFGSLSPMELMLIFVVALLVFGPRKLPELGKSIGKGLSEFRRASQELRSTLEEEVRVEEQRTPPPPAAREGDTPATLPAPPDPPATPPAPPDPPSAS